MNKDLSSGTTLSHYRIVSKIGAGGSGSYAGQRGSDVQAKRLSKNSIRVGLSQYHLAVAGGCEASLVHTNDDDYRELGFAPTRYRKVVLTSRHRIE